MDIATQML